MANCTSTFAKSYILIILSNGHTVETFLSVIDSVDWNSKTVLHAIERCLSSSVA